MQKIKTPVKKRISPFLIILLIIYLPGHTLYAQSWEFIKEKDGIRIYTRPEANSSLKSFKGEATLHTQTAKVFELLGNVTNTSWWDENVKDLKVLAYDKDKLIRYYLVYHVPWPLEDRDLCVESRITTDPVTGIRIIFAQPLLNTVPEKPDKIRIKKYWQKWTVEPLGNNLVHVTLEGFVDPGGFVPAWLYNMVITDAPLKVIHGVQSRVESKN
ncbi:MAG: START domain-containing protein [Bacteroidetes bacterium]|nr:START domain-containing protein [Bacteroidota bacterium]